MEYEVAVSIILILTTVFSRSFARMITTAYTLSDSGFHFNYIRGIKENDNKQVDFVPRVFPRQVAGYPFFYHKLLSYTSEKFVHFFDKFGAGLIDGIQQLLWFGFLIYFDLLNWTTVLLLAIFTFSATHIRSDNRTFTLSARPLGNLWVNIVFLGLLSSYLLSSFVASSIFAFIAALAFTLNLWSSKFANQVLLFQIPFFIVFFVFNPTISGVFLISLSLCIIIFNKQIVRVLRSQILHLTNYKRYISKIHGDTVRIRSILSPFRNLREKSISGLIKDIYYQPILVGMLRNPAIVLVPYFWFLVDIGNNFLFHLLLITTSTIIPWILTSTNTFSFLGNADRYLEYSLFTSLLLILLFPVREPILYGSLIILLMANIVNSYLQVWMTRSTAKQRDVAVEEAEPILEKFNEAKKLTSIPITFFKGLLGQNDHLWFFHAQDHATPGTLEMFMKIYHRRYAWPEPEPFNEILAQYDVDYLLIPLSHDYIHEGDNDKIIATAYGERFEYDFTPFEEFYRSENLIIYEI